MSVTAKLCTAKVTVTVVAAVTVTTQESVPVQASPLQPVKTDPAAGAAVSVTTVPLTKLAVQVTPQSIPAGALVTVPTPVPLGATVSVKFWSANVAVTVVAAVTVTTQGSEPVHPPPLQPVNTEPTAGVAVNVTGVSEGYEAEQVAPQSIPAGVLVTVPVPVPLGVTVRAKPCGAKVAVTVVAAVTVTVQGSVRSEERRVGKECATLCIYRW